MLTGADSFLEDGFMAKIKTPKPENMAELMQQIGDVPLERIRTNPPPGTATEKDVLAAEALPRKRLCELVDGVLIEKAMAAKESLLAGLVIQFLGTHVTGNNLGAVLGADGMLRILPGMVRIPDISFISWDRVPGGVFPNDPIANLIPELAVEVISPSNTKGEMARKLKDYFIAGVQLVWLIYPKTETAEVYTAPDVKTKIGKNGSLDGGAVLPGFSLSLKSLFENLGRRHAV
jgi:Uma2 family endonuclease